MNRPERAERKRRHELCATRKLKPLKNGNGNFSLADAVRYQELRLEDCIIKKEGGE